jgi:hypothetical protein
MRKLYRGIQETDPGVFVPIWADHVVEWFRFNNLDSSNVFFQSCGMLDIEKRHSDGCPSWMTLDFPSETAATLFKLKWF